jgi:hypothetical protein
MGHRTPPRGRRILGNYSVLTTQTPSMYSFGGTPPTWCYLVEGFFHPQPHYTTTAYDPQRCEFIALNTNTDEYEVVSEEVVLNNLREGIYVVSAVGIQQWKMVAYNSQINLHTIIVDSMAT